MAWSDAGKMEDNDQRRIGISTLFKLDGEFVDGQNFLSVRSAPID